MTPVYALHTPPDVWEKRIRKEQFYCVEDRKDLMRLLLHLEGMKYLWSSGHQPTDPEALEDIPTWKENWFPAYLGIRKNGKLYIKSNDSGFLRRDHLIPKANWLLALKAEGQGLPRPTLPKRRVNL